MSKKLEMDPPHRFARKLEMDPPHRFARPQPETPSRLRLLPQAPETDEADPFGLWPVLGLVETVLTSVLDTGQADTNMIVADLTQFDTREEMRRVKTTIERIIVAADDVRQMLETARQPTETTARRPLRLVEATRPVQDAPEHRLPAHPDAGPADVQWSVRQILSFIQSVVCTEAVGAKPRWLATGLRSSDHQRRDHLRKAAELVILAADTVLRELVSMMHPPR